MKQSIGFCTLMLVMCTFVFEGTAHAAPLDVLDCRREEALILAPISGLAGATVASWIAPLIAKSNDTYPIRYNYLENVGWTMLAGTVAGVTVGGFMGYLGCDMEYDTYRDFESYTLVVPFLFGAIAGSVAQAFLWDGDEVLVSLSPTLNPAMVIDGVMGGVGVRF